MGTDYQVVKLFQFQQTWRICQECCRICQDCCICYEIHLHLYCNISIFDVVKLIGFMASKHFVKSTTVSTVDKDTGEIINTESSKVIKVNMGKQEEFFMTYCHYLSSFYELKYADDIKIIIKLNEWAQFETGIVDLTASKRLDITSELGIRNDAISKSLKRLRDNRLIFGERGSYQINPIIFWKGDRAKRKELLEGDGLKLEFSYNIDKEL